MVNVDRDPPDPQVLRQLLLPLLAEPSGQHEAVDAAALGALRLANVELEGLLGLTEGVMLSERPAELAAALLAATVSSFGFARGAVVSGSRRLFVLSGHGLLDAEAGVGSSPAVLRAQEYGRLQAVPWLAADSEPWLRRLLPDRAEVVVVPLVTSRRGHGVGLGALVLEMPLTLRGARRAQVLGLVERGAASAGLVWARQELLAQLERLAATDHLTMIANRRSFTVSLERELARAVRSGQALSLVLLDLDRFKQVNDLHGHSAGDESLRNVAAALVVACRELDTPARYGGEEFAVILPDCGTGQSVFIADRLRDAVASAPGVMRLTASAGVATFPDHATDLEALIDAADEALLRAKRSGRDRTMSAVPRAAPSHPAQRI